MWNDQYVFLHDTPKKRYFGRRTRSLSSGCARVENIEWLARLVLGEEAWRSHRVAERLGSGETFRVELERPVTVVLEYGLADIAEDGEIQFYRDIYGRLNPGEASPEIDGAPIVEADQEGTPATVAGIAAGD